MLEKLIKSLLFCLLLLPATLQAQQSELTDNSLGARYSRHIFIPFLGYVGMNGETYSNELRIDYTPTGVGSDTIAYSQTYNQSYERDRNAPFLGVLYRFRLSRQLHIEGSYAIAHDAISREQNAKLKIQGLPFYFRTHTERPNTQIATLGAGIAIPVLKNIISVGASASGGYAWRPGIETTNDAVGQFEATTNTSDADAMYLGKAGVKASVWRGNQFLIEMSLDYVQFIPTDSDIDPFGGVSWRASVFPIWFGN